MVTRELEGIILSAIKPRKAIMLFRARRVGKTILMEKLIERFGKKVIFLNGEDTPTTDMLSVRTVSNYTQLFQGIEPFHIPGIFYTSSGAYPSV